METLVLPTYDDVVAAATRIEGHAHRTPVLTSRTANRELGAEVFFKCENYQRMGAFKFRGAFNALSKFDTTQRKHGVVAFSSGNHAQGIALSAQLLGIPATIVMPLDAPAAKVAATKEYGATVVAYDRYTEDREAIGRQLAQEQGLTLIPPYDHPDILAGQGTAAKELFEEVGALDTLFVCLAAAGCSVGLRWRRARWHPIAGCTVSSPRPVTMVSNRCAAGTSSGSTRRKPSPMARRPSTWATTPLASSSAMSTTSSPPATRNWSRRCVSSPSV